MYGRCYFIDELCTYHCTNIIVYRHNYTYLCRRFRIRYQYIRTSYNSCLSFPSFVLRLVSYEKCKRNKKKKNERRRKRNATYTYLMRRVPSSVVSLETQADGEQREKESGETGGGHDQHQAAQH